MLLGAVWADYHRCPLARLWGFLLLTSMPGLQACFPTPRLALAIRPWAGRSAELLIMLTSDNASGGCWLQGFDQYSSEA